MTLNPNTFTRLPQMNSWPMETLVESETSQTKRVRKLTTLTRYVFKTQVQVSLFVVEGGVSYYIYSYFSSMPLELQERSILTQHNKMKNPK